MAIQSDFYGGSINVISSTQGQDAVLHLKPDPVLEFMQGFYFSVSGPDQPARLIIENAGQSSFPKGWPDYQAFVSTDHNKWTRTKTLFDQGKLIINHQPAEMATFFAYFPPYTFAQHTELIDFCKEDPRADVTDLCYISPADRAELISVGNASSDALQIWIIARQHPGETQASWWIDGFLRHLLNQDDDHSRILLDHARLHIVPNMNPDGARRGHYRTNVKGHNLNSSWDRSSVDETPTVHSVLQIMEKKGVDLCLDIHGDEEIPFVFIASVDRALILPSFITKALDAFERNLVNNEPCFRKQRPLNRAHTKASPLSFCAPYIMQTCLTPAVTLELPFKCHNASGFGPLEYGAHGAARSGRIAVTMLANFIEQLKTARESRRQFLKATGRR